jgi:hypothetical protein
VILSASRTSLGFALSNIIVTAAACAIIPATRGVSSEISRSHTERGLMAAPCTSSPSDCPPYMTVTPSGGSRQKNKGKRRASKCTCQSTTTISCTCLIRGSGQTRSGPAANHKLRRAVPFVLSVVMTGILALPIRRNDGEKFTSMHDRRAATSAGISLSAGVMRIVPNDREKSDF